VNQIPDFPYFVPIGLEHSKAIKDFVRQFPAYSDFNFLSLYCWNTDGSMAVAELNNNLVFRFSDYTTNEVFYTLIGDDRLTDTCHALLKEAKKQNYLPSLKLVPESCAASLSEAHTLNVLEDQDQHDYLLSVPLLVELQGRKLAHTRELVNRFKREQSRRVKFVEMSLAEPKTRQQLTQVFHVREDLKVDNDSNKELSALQRLIQYPSLESVRTFGIQLEDKLEAFIICELLDEGVALAHFWKANTAVKGMYQYLLHLLAQELQHCGYAFLNFEQDLGIPGLRASKQYLRPVGFLKKYTVEATSA
jgi:hypothetical protein